MKWSDAEKNLVVSLWQQGCYPAEIQILVNRYLAFTGAKTSRSVGAVLLQLEKMGRLPKGSSKVRQRWLKSRRGVP